MHFPTVDNTSLVHTQHKFQTELLITARLKTKQSRPLPELMKAKIFLFFPTSYTTLQRMRSHELFYLICSFCQQYHRGLTTQWRCSSEDRGSPPPNHLHQKKTKAMFPNSSWVPHQLFWLDFLHWPRQLQVLLLAEALWRAVGKGRERFG